MNPSFSPRAFARVVLGLLSVSLLLLTHTSVSRSQTQGEMNATAGKDFEKSDAALNAAYKKLLAVLSKPQKTQLKTAQLAWLKFRDAESTFLASKVQGGSVYPTIYNAHRTDITQQRTRQLQNALKLFTTEGAM